MLTAPTAIVEALTRNRATAKTTPPLTPLGTLREWLAVRHALQALGRGV